MGLFQKCTYLQQCYDWANAHIQGTNLLLKSLGLQKNPRLHVKDGSQWNFLEHLSLDKMTIDLSRLLNKVIYEMIDVFMNNMVIFEPPHY